MKSDSSEIRQRLFKKIQKGAMAIGEELAYRALLLFYVMRDKNTPTPLKGAALAGLLYFLTPLDAIPDFIPGAGYSDDLGVLAATLGVLHLYISDEMREKAQQECQRWFSKKS